MQAEDTQDRALDSRRRLPGGDLFWALAGTGLLCGLVALGEAPGADAWPAAVRLPLAGLRLALGAAFVLVLPGYALTAALYPSRDLGEAGPDRLERVGLSLGLSVAWIPALALLLDRLPWGLRLWPIVLGEAATVLLGLAVAEWRRRGLPARVVTWPRPLRPGERRLALGAALALLGAGLALAWVLLVPAPDTRLTAFYALGPGGQVEGYPDTAIAGRPVALTVGIHSLERDDHVYRVEVWAIDPWAQQMKRVQATGPIPLAPAEQVEWTLTWAMPWPGEDQQVELRLFRDAQADGPLPYRRLRLWLDVTES